MNLFQKPMTAGPNDVVIGRNELGYPVYRTMLGDEYTYMPGGAEPQAAPEFRPGLLATTLDSEGRAIHTRGPENAPRPGEGAAGVMGGLAQGLWRGVAAPAAAMRGEPVTLGDVWGTALDWGALSAPMSAPDGALRAGGARTAGETPAQQIAGLLREGRAGDVTDDMMASADDRELWNLYQSGATGQPMPMDEASRMARAEGMGFDTGTPLYHGTRRNFQAFSRAPSKSTDHGWYGDGTYLGNAELASEYAMSGPKKGRNVVPVFTRGPQMDWPEGMPAFMTANDAAAGSQDVRALGYNGVDVRVPEGFNDAGALHERVVFDPADIRSRFARFDPRLKDLANLSAGVAGAGAMTAANQYEDSKRRIAQYLAQRGL